MLKRQIFYCDNLIFTWHVSRPLSVVLDQLLMNHFNWIILAYYGLFGSILDMPFVFYVSKLYEDAWTIHVDPSFYYF